MAANIKTVGNWAVIEGEVNDALVELDARPGSVVQGFSVIGLTDMIKILVYIPATS